MEAPTPELCRLWQLSRNGIDTAASAAAAINGGPSIEGKEAADATAPETEDPVATIAE
jgi:hypothetical protein